MKATPMMYNNHTPRFITMILSILIVTWMSSCIDELDIDTETGRNLLVVEGSINTGLGPHEILISKSAKYGSILDDAIRKETNAVVYIRDEQGNQVFLDELNDGSYFTPEGYRAEVGKKYTLFVTLANGERYISLPESVVAVPEIELLRPIYKRLPSTSNVTFESGIEIFAEWQDPSDETNFYLWKSRGVYKLNARPDLHVGRDFFGNPFPDPKECCATCFVYEQSNDLRIFKDNLTNGNKNVEVISFIEDDGRKIADRYLAIVEQHSLTKEAYQFFDLLQNQLSIEGDIFDPPPATIRGNMISLDNPDEEVIGYFYASDVAYDSIYITPNLLDEPQVIQVLNDDCRVLAGSTTETPPFWQ